MGAKVTVTSTTKSFTYDTTTNESGNYSVTHLIPDTYKVHVEATGFQITEIASVVLNADTAATVDAHLLVGAVTQTVEVTGEVPQLQTDRADVDVQFSQKYVEDLPVLNRNFTSFELLSPGTQKCRVSTTLPPKIPQGGGQIQVNGQHFSGTNFELDGTDNQDPILGIIVVNPNLDAIAEAKIALQDYDAESGKATAGTVGVQIKSGSNDFHGTGFSTTATATSKHAIPLRTSLAFLSPPPLGNSLAVPLAGPSLRTNSSFLVIIKVQSKFRASRTYTRSRPRKCSALATLQPMPQVPRLGFVI